MRKLRLALLALALLVIAILATGYALLRSSLPTLDGELSADALHAEVSIERDDLGVVTIRGANRADVAWATGYAHAQDRFFQMDLARRVAAGELAELFGAVALDADKEKRVHQLRTIAREVLRRATGEEREFVERYTAGVNAGLASLRARPFEYWILRTQPAPWRAEDSVLVTYAMWFDLAESFGYEAARGVVRATLPAELETFLYSAGSEWDAPLIGPALEVAPIPGPEIYDLRKLPPPQPTAPAEARLAEGADEFALGSNNWAVAGLHTASGAALLANDMHLGLRVPSTWYRARLRVAASDDVTPSLDITGVTLAGTPLVVAGSNGSIAWGFTNSYGDWCDLVLLDTEAAASNQYLTPDGPREFEHAREILRVHGGEDVVFDVRRTIWGPVLDEDPQGRPRAGVWTAHYPEATNLMLWQLELTTDVPGALDVAARGGIPPQNFVVADRTGNIGWTIMGRIPLRVGFDPSVPASWSAPGVGWQGWLAPSAYPRLANPPQGRIWTANQRTVDGQALQIIGDHGYAFGARAGQIRDDLLARETLSERDMLAIQLDDHSRIHERWRKKLLELLDEQAIIDHPERAEARRLVEGWLGRAATNSAGFRILRAWRDRLRERALGALTTAVRAKDPGFKVSLLSRTEGPLWRLVDAEPVHLLDPAFATWRDFELAMLDELIVELEGECGSLAACTWGKRNRVEVRHPLSRAIPLLKGLTDMPTVELPGDIYTVRVQGPGFGASERFAVSPGHEADAYIHMPGGQSGHPLSPFYRAGFNAWAEGRALPFLPGTTRHRLAFTPTN
jgi:penicillin amidase